MAITTERLQELHDRAKEIADIHSMSAGWYMNMDIAAITAELLKQRADNQQFDPDNGAFNF